MLFSRKRHFEGDFEARLEDAFRRAIAASKVFGKDTGASFGTGEVLLRVPDRLHVKNDDAGFVAAEPIVRAVATKVFGSGAAVSMEREGSPAESLTLRLRIEGGPADLDGLFA